MKRGTAVKIFLCIRSRDYPVYSLSHDSHERLLKQEGIKDDKVYDRDFVRVQLWPKGCWFDPMVKFNGWNFAVDEENTLPAWFDKEYWLDRCLANTENHILPFIKIGTFPGDMSISKDETIDSLKEITGGLYVNASAVFTVRNLKQVGGKVVVSMNAKLISSMKGF